MNCYWCRCSVIDCEQRCNVIDCGETMKLIGLAIRALLVLLVVLVLTPVAASAEIKAGVTVLSARSGNGSEIEIRIKVAKPPSIFPFQNKYLWGGGEGEPPALLIESVDVAVAGEQVFVPLSAFTDLGSPKRISLKVSGSEFEVTIIGGDAGGAYDAVLTFDGSWLVRRRVASREFSDEAWEESRYSFNHN